MRPRERRPAAGCKGHITQPQSALRLRPSSILCHVDLTVLQSDQLKSIKGSNTLLRECTGCFFKLCLPIFITKMKTLFILDTFLKKVHSSGWLQLVFPFGKHKNRDDQFKNTPCTCKLDLQMKKTTL